MTTFVNPQKLASLPTTLSIPEITLLAMKANRVREIRENRGLTQEELAARLGTDKGTISRIESGRRRLTQDWMHRISRVLECATWELLPLDEQPSPLSPDEQAILDLYRGLTEHERTQFRAVAHALAKPGAVEGNGKKRGNGNGS